VQRQAGKYDASDLEDRYETRLRAMIVGDTPYDAEAFGKIGLRTVGVFVRRVRGRRSSGRRLRGTYRDPADLLERLAI
jgi:phosphoglycolate phosphatase-like HAD superfamily hydrolase